MPALTMDFGLYDATDTLINTFHLPYIIPNLGHVPGVNDDDTAGFVATSLAAYSGIAYVCVSNATGAAVWTTIGSGGGALLAANNLSDLANAGTARTNLGLGSAATQASSAFDAAGSAATAQTAAEAASDPAGSAAAVTLTTLGGTAPTGTGAVVLATSPMLVTPALGTPASGNLANCTFPTLNQSTSGNAATATKMAAPVNINGVAFDGSADITVAAAAGTLTGATLAAGVTGSSLTSFGNSPTFVTPALGTPASGNLSSCTGYPYSALTGAPSAGTVTSISVVSANGFAGTVANPTTTPAITLTTMPPSPGFIQGFQLAYASTTTITVGRIAGTAGSCADSYNLVTLTLSSQATITPGTFGAIGGNDAFQGPGTATSSAAVVTGTTTNFFTVFGTRAGAGTISSSTTTVTGVGTNFLNQVAVGDLIGNITSGYFQVTAIASNTSLTINATPGTPFSTSNYNVIENPTFQSSAGGSNTYQVISIASITSLTLSATPNVAASGNYLVGTMPYAAVAPSKFLGVAAATGGGFAHVWVGNGGGGTGCWVSTQRTLPFGISSYTSFVRRVGVIAVVGGAGTAGTVQAFWQDGSYNDRVYTWEVSGAAVLSAGAATTAATIQCDSWAPPTAIALYISATQITGGQTTYRVRGIGASGTSRNQFTGGPTPSNLRVSCDGAQCIDYFVSNSSDTVSISVSGFQEQL